MSVDASDVVSELVGQLLNNKVNNEHPVTAEETKSKHKKWDLTKICKHKLKRANGCCGVEYAQIEILKPYSYKYFAGNLIEIQMNTNDENERISQNKDKNHINENNDTAQSSSSRVASQIATTLVGKLLSKPKSSMVPLNIAGYLSNTLDTLNTNNYNNNSNDGNNVFIITSDNFMEFVCKRKYIVEIKFCDSIIFRYFFTDEPHQKKIDVTTGKPVLDTCISDIISVTSFPDEEEENKNINQNKQVNENKLK